jgi:hypothetical protein
MQANLVNGWREVLARIFDGFETEYGVSPEWLVNPDTNRRLKLDCLFPDVGVAVRFIGLEGSTKRRKSDEEVLAEAEREHSRADVCRAHGVVLISIDPDGEPRVALRSLEMGLARAAAQLAQNTAVPHATKQKLMPQLSLARRRAGEFTAKLNPPEKLSIYAEMWWDRQASLSASTAATKKPAANSQAYRVGMEVVHERFGPGRITEIAPDGKDLAITVDFPESGVRTFYASLVEGKLTPQ